MLKYTGRPENTQDLTFEEYEQFNAKFKRRLIWRFGTGNGFFSELNGLLLGMLYAAQYGYRFVLYSKDKLSGMPDGWEDVFLPFCPRFNSSFIGKSILTGTRHNCNRNKVTSLYKLFTRNITEDDVFWYTHTNRFSVAEYDIPALGIKGDIRQAMRRLIPLVYRFNHTYRRLINEQIKTISLPDSYIGLHIRAGDKAREIELIAPQRYIETAGKASDTRNAFVFTDDFNVIVELRRNNPKWHIFSLTADNESGYNIQKLASISPEERRAQLVRMFASIEILLNSELFIGTFSSNPGMFAGMLLDEKHIVGMDFPKWLLL